MSKALLFINLKFTKGTKYVQGKKMAFGKGKELFTGAFRQIQALHQNRIYKILQF